MLCICLQLLMLEKREVQDCVLLTNHQSTDGAYKQGMLGCEGHLLGYALVYGKRSVALGCLVVYLLGFPQRAQEVVEGWLVTA